MTAAVVGSAMAADDADLAAVIEKMRVAMVAGDGAALRTFVADELTYGHSSGKLMTKEDFVKDLDGTNSFKSVTLSNQTIRIVGDNGVVRNTFDSVNNVSDGTTTTSHIGVLQVWKKSSDGWKLLARQAFALPKT